MYVRVVRFTGVNAERLEELLARAKESGGPPEGVPTTGLRILLDKDQGTAAGSRGETTPAPLKQEGI